jgi:hypothetical protein
VRCVAVAEKTAVVAAELEATILILIHELIESNPCLGLRSHVSRVLVD